MEPSLPLWVINPEGMADINDIKTTRTTIR